MAQLTPRQQAARTRIEALIRLAQPALDLVLSTGERLSRAMEREELDAPLARPLAPDAGRGGRALPPANGAAS
jgi:hypothetical protein